LPHKLSASVQSQVRQRANFLCEYCHTDENWQYVLFSIDHIVPVAEGGEDQLENLALACFHCNRHKSNKQIAFDRETEQSVPLFNPRQHRWSDHFIWSGNGLLVIPLTDTGRATVDLLELNRDRIQQIRSADASVGRHPPFADPVQPIG
jgi:hypothetical protein